MSEFRPIIEDLPTQPLHPRDIFPQESHDENEKKGKKDHSDSTNQTMIELDGFNEEDDDFFDQGVAARRVTPVLSHLLGLFIAEAIFVTPILVLTLVYGFNLTKTWDNRFKNSSERYNDLENGETGTSTKYNANALVSAEISIKFFLWACLTVFMWVNTNFWLSAIPQIVLRVTKLFKRTASEKVKRRLEYYVAASPMLKVSFAAAWGVGLWVLIFPYSPAYPAQGQPPMWEHVVYTVLLCILTWALLISIEKLLVQIIAVRFHQTAYKDRIKESKYGSYILDRLSKAKYKSESRADGNGEFKVLGSPHMPDTPSDSKYNNNSSYFPEQKPKHKAVSTINFDSGTATTSESVDFHSQFEAKRVARKLFSALRGGRYFLIVDDFYPYFPNRDDAQTAFNYLDKDGNGDLTKGEMVEKISSIYKERKDLSTALRDSTQAVGQLDKIFLCIAGFIGIWICLLFFNVDLWSLLVPFGSLILGLSFVFGSSAAELFSSVIFLFAMHPYDAGDRVVINKEIMNVNRIGLLGTEFTHSNGQIIYLPHSVLKTAYVYNMRRATNQAEQIDFEMAFDTPIEKINALRDKINNYLKHEESRDFHADPTIALYGMSNANIMKWFVWLEHKSNWQEGGKRWIRTTRFTLALRRFFHELDITYSMPPTPVTYSYHNNGSATTIAEHHQTSTAPPPALGVLPHLHQQE